ncbi:MAG: bifunctional DNA-formamidopyrimidine glycosylase/DNA-(apurinic or apyrimidinic site) lyase [Candidatus Parcubacteria bacterium]|nr:bifunctional DNA-formamidopyrimidine glycosylase/DNA-(apurinic or apyrimidinic site) lyase [Candidatus Parcubacteria bacterium]
MPELPEVETTTKGLRKTIIGLSIKDVWTDLSTKDKRQVHSVANPSFFKIFKKDVLNKKVLSVQRRAKNILINLSKGKTILVHLKMTGHLLYGAYSKLKVESYKVKSKFKEKWVPNENKDSPLHDPFNKYVHVIFTLSNGKHLAFSDARKFGKVTLLDTKTMHETKHLNNIGPEPLSKNFQFPILNFQLMKKPDGKIKTVLMDQSIIAGIGNIYSDEILWRAGVHPERKISKITDPELKLIFKAIKEILAKGIDFGGDSMSDYRNIHGLPGKFQLHHQAYRRTGEKCNKKNCKGIIQRKVINTRSAHFCSVHQK